MDPVTIISRYFVPDSAAFDILIEHSTMVMTKALAVAERVRHLSPDLTFIREAAMIHDIGIFLVNAPQIGCHGSMPYICHGYLGRELLEKEGFPLHALICERHIGTGIEIRDIEAHDLPLPLRDMRPQTIEERIVCYADKFFSKEIGRLQQEKSVYAVREELKKFGPEKLGAFEEMHLLFSNKPFQETGRPQEQ